MLLVVVSDTRLFVVHIRWEKSASCCRRQVLLQPQYSPLGTHTPQPRNVPRTSTALRRKELSTKFYFESPAEVLFTKLHLKTLYKAALVSIGVNHK